jgi:hypothetical protein
VVPSPARTPTKAPAVPRADLRHPLVTSKRGRLFKRRPSPSRAAMPCCTASGAAGVELAPSAPFRHRSTYPAHSLAPIETHPTAVVPTPRRGSRSRGWHRTASRSTAAGCPSVSTPTANCPRVISHTSLTSFLADPATGAAGFRRTAAPPRPGTQLLALFTF